MPIPFFMDTLYGIFLTSFIVGLSGALMPGPVLTATISHTLQRGFWAGPWVVLGHGVLELTLVLALFYGIGSVIQQPVVLGIMGVTGGIILIWMGAGMLYQAPHLSFSTAIQPNPITPRVSTPARWYRLSHHPAGAGLLTSLSNPYWALWWATIGLGYVGLAQGLGVAGIVSFYGGHILSDLVWYSLVSWGFAWGRAFISDKLYRKLIFGCGLFLIGFGLYFGFLGTRSFWGS